MNHALKIDPLIKKKIDSGEPVVAVESAILTHGLPSVQAESLVKKIFNLCQERSVSPAFLSLNRGDLSVGMPEKDLLSLIARQSLKKVSYRNLGVAMAKKWSGGTTVSSGVYLAKQCKLPVFCTGGIGGVHRGFKNTFDISQDIFVLSKTPVLVISSGAKAILDLHKTFEALEFFGIPVVGYNTNEFPAFWSKSSGILLESSVSSPSEVSAVWKHHLRSGVGSALIIANPAPEKHEISYSEISAFVDSALMDAKESGVCGPAVTPFVLSQLNEKTGGRCLEANLALAINNFKLGVEVSKLI